MSELMVEAKRGIAMNERNVPRVMDGTKTQTRRIESILRSVDDLHDYCDKLRDGDCLWFFRLSHSITTENTSATGYDDVYPNHQPGDVLYVKEALQRYEDVFGLPSAKYKTDGEFVVPSDIAETRRLWQSDDGKPWKNSVIPARYMPRSAARTFIEITDVRCERVQDISGSDCYHEGIDLGHLEGRMGSSDMRRMDFKKLWSETNGADAWERNDWVFAYTFKVL